MAVVEERLSDDEVRAGCLAWCNEIRGKKGKEPLNELPKGKQLDPASCPCGTATGAYVLMFNYDLELKKGVDPSTEEITNHDFVNGADLPPVVTEFVRRFDEGLFLDLIDTE